MPVDLPLVVGPLTASAGEVHALIAEVISSAYPRDVAEGAIANGYSPSRLASMLENRTWFEARVAGRLIGVAAMHLDGPTAYLGSVMVRIRRSGVAATLGQALLTEALHQGAECVRVHAHPWNAPSLAALERYGFREVRREPDPWTGTGELIVLEKPLT